MNEGLVEIILRCSFIVSEEGLLIEDRVEVLFVFLFLAVLLAEVLLEAVLFAVVVALHVLFAHFAE